MSIEQNLCEVKKVQLQSMSNAIRHIDGFAFKNSGIACLALIFNLSYLRSTILHPKYTESILKTHIMIPFFSSDWYKPMAEWLRLVVDSLASQWRHGFD